MEAIGLLGLIRGMESPADYILFFLFLVTLIVFFFTVKSRLTSEQVSVIVSEKIEDKLKVLKAELITEIRLIRHDVNSLDHALDKLIKIEAVFQD